MLMRFVDGMIDTALTVSNGARRVGRKALRHDIQNMALELGTAYSSVFVQGRGVIELETKDLLGRPVKSKTLRTMVARQRLNGREFEAVGQDAYERLGRSASNKLFRPVREGRIFAEDEFLYFAQMMLYKAQPSFASMRRYINEKPILVFPVPCNTTAKDREAVREKIIKLHCRPVLVWQPVAAAIGAGLKFRGNRTCAIIDIGGGTTDFAAISLSDAVAKPYSIPFGGDNLDDLIVVMLRKRGLVIGKRTAEWVKQTIGTAVPGSKRKKVTVRGKPLVEGQPDSVEIYDDEVFEAIKPTLKQISDGAIRWLESTHLPEVHRDINEGFIALTGGGALLDRMADFLIVHTGRKVIRVDMIPEQTRETLSVGRLLTGTVDLTAEQKTSRIDPQLTVILGAGEILGDEDLLYRCDIDNSPWSEQFAGEVTNDDLS